MSADSYGFLNVHLNSESDLTPGEGEALIGKTIAEVHGDLCNLKLTFTDGSVLELTGYEVEGGGLHASLEAPDW